jgi:hypothetical protein
MRRNMLALAAILTLTALVQAPDASGPRLPADRPTPPARAETADEPVLDAERRERAGAAAERALAWLAAAQQPNGYWRGHVGHKQGDDYLILRPLATNDALGQGHMGVTALAGMAFLAGGHLPDRGPHGTVMRRCLDYVLAHVTDSGVITDGGTRMYSHAFATLFLAEVYGMSGGREVRAGLEKAVHLIVDCQNRQGGWRYNPFTQEADMSVTVCQLQALRAARNIGIQVPKNTVDEAVAYVMRARGERGSSRGLYYYKTQGRGAWDKNREYAINAAAVTALYTAGVQDPELHEPTLDWLAEEYAAVLWYYPTHYYYWYGNYYACQAFFQAGGTRYREYQQRITDDLLRAQLADGRFVNHTGPGDTFATAVAALILQLPKQYLPIFQR